MNQPEILTGLMNKVMPAYRLINKWFFFIAISASLLLACRVTFISGYDPLIDETTTKIKRDFNLHFIKLLRTLQDTDPQNQNFANYLDYYDNLEVDLLVLKDRTRYLDAKSAIVKKQVNNLDSVMHAFISLHKSGMADSQVDDRRDIRLGINSSLDAVIRLQEALKTTGKLNEQ